jgi:hypothetical protein
MITDYLVELVDELNVPLKRRRRIVAEVEDHLQCAAAELHASGLDIDAAEREAVRRFGSARELARAFHEDAAAVAGRSAGRAAVVLTALLVLIEADPPGIVTWGRAGFPAGPLAFVFGQVGLVAGALTLVRLFRARATRGPRGVRLALVLRGTLVVTVCAAVTFACGVGVVAGAAGAPPLRSLLSLVALGAATLATARMLWRGRHRASAAGLDAAAAPTAEEDALSDLAAIGAPVLKPLVRRLPRLTAWFNLRAHPWRVASLVALAAGLALGLAHGVSEGGPPPPARLPMAVLAGLVLTSIEAGAVLAGFFTLGRYLGLRPRAGSPTADGPTLTP